MNRRSLILSALVLAAPGTLRAGVDAPYTALRADLFTGGDGEVRLADIIAPDPASLRGWPQPYAKEARAGLARLLAGQVRIEELAPPDRWGRRIARVLGADGVSLQEKLTEAGAARVRPESADDAFIRRLLDRESEARAARRGLWRLSAYRIRNADGASDAVGGFHLVEGAILAAVKHGGRIYLNFGEDFRTDFTATAKSASARRWRKQGLTDLESLAGARGRARGHVAWINGPSVEIAHPLQIERLYTDD